jgi:hypothetical protein
MEQQLLLDETTADKGQDVLPYTELATRQLYGYCLLACSVKFSAA